MSSVKDTLATMRELFKSGMEEFQRDLRKTSSPTSTSSLAAEFSSFKTFVFSTLDILQRQVELLAREADNQEMRRRRRMLLLHGVPEEKSEDTTTRVTGLIGEHLLLPDFSSSCIKYSYRLGRTLNKKPRPIVVKFSDVSTRDRVWYAKTKFKGTGVTQSEFLVKNRHDVFLEARSRFGISNCWTRDGIVYIIAADGSRHKAECLSDLNDIPTSTSDNKSPSQAKADETKSTDRVTKPRTKRVIKK